MKDVCIRADGSTSIGLGHVVRCMSLAQILQNEFSIHFYSISLPDSLKNEIIHKGWQITTIFNEVSFLDKLTGSEIVILDGYQFDSNHQKKIKNKGCKLICIDDFHDQHFYADLVINHSPGVTKDDYKGELYTKYLLGPKYALLRPEFLNRSSHSKKINSGELNKIFLCFGGSDSKNLTSDILSWLPSMNYEITVVIGEAFVHRYELNKVIEERQDLNIFLKESLNAVEIKNELDQTDLAIVPSSGILFEVISVGVPVISGYYTDNQLSIYEGFLNENVFVDAKSFSKKRFGKAFNNAKSSDLNIFVKNQSNLIDDNVVDRLRSEISKIC